MEESYVFLANGKKMTIQQYAEQKDRDATARKIAKNINKAVKENGIEGLYCLGQFYYDPAYNYGIGALYFCGVMRRTLRLLTHEAWRAVYLYTLVADFIPWQHGYGNWRKADPSKKIPVSCWDSTGMVLEDKELTFGQLVDFLDEEYCQNYKEDIYYV